MVALALVAMVKVCKLAGESVWQCRAYGADGRRMPDADCEETSKAAAEDTAAAMVAPYAEQLAADAAAIVRTLPVASRKYAAAFRTELETLCNIAADSYDGSETLTARQLVAGAIIDVLALGQDAGGHYPPGLPLTAENGGREWRAIFAEATRQVAGGFSAEYAEHCRRMAEIDAQFLSDGLPAASL